MYFADPKLLEALSTYKITGPYSTVFVKMIADDRLKEIKNKKEVTKYILMQSKVP